MAFSGKRRLLKGGVWATFTVIVWELVEIAFEYLIAIFVSSAVTFFIIKTLTTFAIVKATELASIPIGKGVLVFFRKIFYIKGDNKLNFIKKIWNFIVSNKCSFGVVLSSVLVALCGSSVINVNDLPSIAIKVDEGKPAVVQEVDIIATETIYGKEAVIATETIYGDPMFATEIVYSEEPVYADDVVYSVEPIYATETIYSEIPVYASKVTFVANEIIYENDGTTIKYNVGDYVEGNDIDKYIDSLDVFMTGDLIKEGVVLYEKGDLVKEGVVLYEKGALIKEGVVLYNVGDYMGMEVLYNEGDVIEPAEILFNEGDVITPAGTILEEEVPAKTFNLTPIIFWVVMGGIIVVCGVFFENPQDFAKRIAEKLNLKQEKANIKTAKKELAEEEKAKLAERQQKVQEAEANQKELEQRSAIEKIKADIKAGNI